MVFVFDPPNVAATGATSTHHLKNEGVTRMAFKIKSSNNVHYRMKPVYGFIDPGASIPVKVIRHVSPVGEDKLAIQFAEVPSEETNLKAPFQAGVCQRDVVVNVIAFCFKTDQK